MKKRSSFACKFFLVVAVTLLTISSLSFACAADLAIDATKEATSLNYAAYWLYNLANSKWNTLSSDDASWALLAFSSFSATSDESEYALFNLTEDGKNSLISKGKDNECWPSTNCKVKSTAYAMIALNDFNEDTTLASDWILKKQKAYTTSGVSWYLQLDSDDVANCTITYPTDTSTITAKLNLNKNKTYSWKEGNGGSCLSISTDKYWLSLASNCIDKTFTISCNKNGDSTEVIASLPYKYSSELYVPSESTRSSSSFNMAIKTLCLKESTNECDYESTLWATYALYLTGRSEYSSFLPYLVEQYSSNKQYFPEALLYKMTYSQDYLDSILGVQKRAGFFEASSSSNGKYYDTAIAVSTIGGIYTSNTTKAKIWLIDNQTSIGYEWGTSGKIRDTSMIFYYIWPNYRPLFLEAGPVVPVECPDNSYFNGTSCITCPANTVFDGEDCVFESCPSNYVYNGTACITCPANTFFNGSDCLNLACPFNTVFNGTACVLEIYTAPEENITFTECEDTYLFSCRSRCTSLESKANYSCGTNRKVCCKPKELPVDECESTYSFFCRTSCVEGEESSNYTCVSGICCKPKGESIKCNDVNDCKKRECRGKTVEDDNGNLGTCEYPSEFSCNDDFDNDGDRKVDYNDEIDCSKKCYEKDGVICDPGQICDGSTINAFDTNECCLGECTKDESPTCSSQGGFVCDAGKCSGSLLSASDTSNCCSSKCSSNKTIWIVLLVLLILGAIGFFLYKKGFFSSMMIRFSKKSPPKSPSMMQYNPSVRPLHAPQMPSNMTHPPVHPVQRKEGKSELDETLNRLKRFAEK